MRWWDRPSDLVPPREWWDSIEVRTRSIQSYLAELPDAERDRAIADYLETVAPEDRDDEHRELLSLIENVRSDWARVGRLKVGGLRYSVSRYREVALRVPLFEFSAPDVEGCSMSIRTSTSRSPSGTWRVSIGAGAGSTNRVLVSFTATFSAGRGEGKEVFIPVRALAVRTYLTAEAPSERAGRPAGLIPFRLDGGFDEVRVLPAELPPVPVVRSIPASQPSGGRILNEYPLGQDAIHGRTEYEYTQEVTEEYTVGAGAEIHGVGVTASASVSLAERLTLRFVLSGGRDYRLKNLPDRPGVYWEY